MTTSRTGTIREWVRLRQSAPCAKCNTPMRWMGFDVRNHGVSSAGWMGATSLRTCVGLITEAMLRQGYDVALTSDEHAELFVMRTSNDRRTSPADTACPVCRRGHRSAGRRAAETARRSRGRVHSRGERPKVMVFQFCKARESSATTCGRELQPRGKVQQLNPTTLPFSQ